jgi:radical SAM protein with 4Fe4S-binding SPASM domain
MCGIEFDFEYFLINLSYFYNICKNSTGGGGAKVWVKIPDIVVNTPERQEIFKEIFYDKCDFMTIQSISPVFSGIDYKAIKPDYDSTFFNETKLINVDVCPQPFYTMTLLADGSVSPCCETERICMGNINNVTIYNIWNSATFKQFRYAHLKYSYKNINTCKDCKMPLYFNNSFDNIDSIKEKLLAAYEC